MFKLVLEKAEEPETKLPTSAGSLKKAREFQKGIYFCFIDYAKAFVWITKKLLKILKEKGMATHSSILAWRILWTEEPGGLQSMGSQRVGHN